jgi:hypothetical protein
MKLPNPFLSIAVVLLATNVIQLAVLIVAYRTSVVLRSGYEAYNLKTEKLARGELELQAKQRLWAETMLENGPMCPKITPCIGPPAP